MTRSLILIFTLFLVSCATTPLPPTLIAEPPTPEQSRVWEQHYQHVKQLTGWVLTGRIVVNTDDDGWNGELHWSQLSHDYEIQFSAPFGQGAFQLEGGQSGVEMRFSDGNTYQAADVETLLVEQLGWHLPLNSFKYWVTGIPRPGAAYVLKYRPDGRLDKLQQGQWLVNYPDYVTIESVMMPRKVFLENHELNVRLVIDRWELNI